MRLTPAMASGLTDHLWSMQELLSYHVAPAPFPLPKRSPKRIPPKPQGPKRARGADLPLPISPVSANFNSSGERSFNMLFEFVHQLAESYLVRMNDMLIE